MFFSDHIITFLSGIDREWTLPKGIELIYPFDDREVWQITTSFYQKFYRDTNNRHFMFGINPGRLGAGVTGIPFTDPLFLSSHCGIEHQLEGTHELSSVFMYDMMGAYGGPGQFYSKFYVTSVCPLGFLKDGKNYNYYDDTQLLASVRPQVVKYITEQIERLCYRDKAYSIGKGRNFKILNDLNETHGWFGEIIPLPHPRWVMQYNRKKKNVYIDEYLTRLGPV